jgi:hypothetical protein
MKRLKKILITAGAPDHTIEMIGEGPFIAAAHMILQSFPRIIRVPIFLPFFFFDKMYKLAKGKNARPYALGYYFKVQK